MLIALADVTSSVGDVLVAGVPASVVIVLLVEVAKRVGMPTRFAPVFAIGMGVVLMLFAQVVILVPALRVWWAAVGTGLMLGLSACGLYSGAKAMTIRSGRGRYRELPTGDVVEAAEMAAHIVK